MDRGKEFVFVLSEMGLHWSDFSKGVIVSAFVLR